MSGATTPSAIEQAGPDTLRIRWGDGHESVYPVRNIRLSCRCAHCIEETTGVPLLDPDSVPADVRPVHIAGVGRYAIRIEWSDGHDTGIYPFDNLRSICPCCIGPGPHVTTH
jgi:ATP-binding protein involved in chromosome partitioning